MSYVINSLIPTDPAIFSVLDLDAKTASSTEQILFNIVKADWSTQGLTEGLSLQPVSFASNNKKNFETISKNLKQLIKTSLKDTTSLLSEVEKRSLYQQVAEHFNRFIDHWRADDIVKSLHICPQVFDSSIPYALINPDDVEFDLDELKNTLQMMSQNELVLLVNATIPLFTDSMSTKNKMRLVDIMYHVSHSERAALVEDAKLFITNTTGINEKIRFLRVVRGISHQERIELIKDTELLFTNSMVEQDKLSYLEGMRWVVPCLGRRELIQDVTPLFTNSMQASEKIQLLKAMHAIPHSERAALIEDTNPLLTDSMQVNQKIDFLLAMRTVPNSERVHLGKTAPLLFSDDMTTTDRIAFFNALKLIPYTERVEIIEDIKTLFSGVSLKIAQKIQILRYIGLIPKEQRSLFTQEIQPLLAILFEKAFQNPVLIFYLLPAALRTQEALSRPAQLLRDQEYRMAILASLERVLWDEENQKMLLTAAHFVKRYQGKLQLHEESSLFQRTIEVLVKESLSGEKNPFLLYKKLQTRIQEPVNIPLSECDVAGRKTAFCIEGLQASGKAFQVSRDMLPADATEAVWLQMVQNLKDKIETNEAAQEYLKAKYITWDVLWEISLSDSYLSGLLKLSGAKVSIAEAQFRAVVHYLLSKNTEVKSGEIFSEQEEILIQLGMMIVECTGGKKRGISQCYSWLPTEVRYPAQDIQGRTPEEVEAKQFIADEVQRIIESQFSGTNALMQELTGLRNIKQAPHQAIYLKNLIGPLVGLRHELIFDVHVSMLDDTLLARSREEVLEIFFRHMTPLVLAQDVADVVNSDFPKYCKLITPLISEEQMETGWEWDEEQAIPVRLTIGGALQLLQSTGYVR